MDTNALLIELIEAMQAQTAVIADQAEAIGRLADSNQQLIAALADIDEGDDLDRPQATYLDGSPCL
jgi:glycosyltransferase A (GT-A) superfamily protein (DUF2064 family)